MNKKIRWIAETAVMLALLVTLQALTKPMGQLVTGSFVNTVLAVAALVGGLIAYLFYNWHPAKVFMGDTGSLFLGGMVCGLAFALNLPLVIPIIGLIYVAEVVSDIIQVVYFKKTGGKRFFRMAPLHHHLELGGWSEVKLVAIFTIVSAIFCVAALLGVIGRYHF